MATYQYSIQRLYVQRRRRGHHPNTAGVASLAARTAAACRASPSTRAAGDRSLRQDGSSLHDGVLDASGDWSTKMCAPMARPREADMDRSCASWGSWGRTRAFPWLRTRDNSVQQIWDSTPGHGHGALRHGRDLQQSGLRHRVDEPCGVQRPGTRHSDTTFTHADAISKGGLTAAAFRPSRTPVQRCRPSGSPARSPRWHTMRHIALARSTGCRPRFADGWLQLVLRLAPRLRSERHDRLVDVRRRFHDLPRETEGVCGTPSLSPSSRHCRRLNLGLLIRNVLLAKPNMT